MSPGPTKCFLADCAWQSGDIGDPDDAFHDHMQTAHALEGWIVLRIMGDMKHSKIAGHLYFRVKTSANFIKVKKSYCERYGVSMDLVSFSYKENSESDSIVIEDTMTPTSLNMRYNGIITATLSCNPSMTWSEKIEYFYNEGIRSGKEIVKNNEEMLESKYMTDFKIICQEETFECHKLILGSSSEYFKALIGADMSESLSGEVEIKDMEPETVKAMIKFIYSGKITGYTVDDRMRFSHPTSDVMFLDPIEENIEAVEKLLVAGDRFDLPSLKRHSEQILISEISPKNALDLFILGNTHNAGKLKEAAKEMLISMVDIAESTEWREKLVGDHADPTLLCKLTETLAKKNRRRSKRSILVRGKYATSKKID